MPCEQVSNVDRMWAHPLVSLMQHKPNARRRENVTHMVHDCSESDATDNQWTHLLGLSINATHHHGVLGANSELLNQFKWHKRSCRDWQFRVRGHTNVWNIPIFDRCLQWHFWKKKCQSVSDATDIWRTFSDSGRCFASEEEVFWHQQISFSWSVIFCVQMWKKVFCNAPN